MLDRISDALSRRAILKAAPIAAVLPVASAFASPALINESAELVAAARAVAEADARFHAARDAFKAAVAEWAPKWPAAPDACLNKDWMGLRWGDEIERDLLGEPIDRADAEFGRAKLCSVKELEDRAQWLRDVLAKDDKRKKKVSRQTRAHWESEIAQCELGAELLPGYRAECDRIKSASNIERIKAERHEAARATYQAVWDILAIPHATMAGLQVKAEAVAVLGRMPRYDRIWSDIEDAGKDLPSMAAVLAEAVLQVGRAQA